MLHLFRHDVDQSGVAASPTAMNLLSPLLVARASDPGRYQ